MAGVQEMARWTFVPHRLAGAGGVCGVLPAFVRRLSAAGVIWSERGLVGHILRPCQGCPVFGVADSRQSRCAAFAGPVQAGIITAGKRGQGFPLAGGKKFFSLDRRLYFFLNSRLSHAGCAGSSAMRASARSIARASASMRPYSGSALWQARA